MIVSLESNDNDNCQQIRSHEFVIIVFFYRYRSQPTVTIIFRFVRTKDTKRFQRQWYIVATVSTLREPKLAESVNRGEFVLSARIQRLTTRRLVESSKLTDFLLI